MNAQATASHPWRRFDERKAKLKAARNERARIYALKYRHENLEECRRKEREWHRFKAGVPLDALDAPPKKTGRPIARDK